MLVAAPLAERHLLAAVDRGIAARRKPIVEPLLRLLVVVRREPASIEATVVPAPSSSWPTILLSELRAFRSLRVASLFLDNSSHSCLAAADVSTVAPSTLGTALLVFE